MNIVESLINYLKKKNTPEEIDTPEGLCPNCWGREEYGGHFYERVQQENLNAHSKESQVGWVTAYANKNLHGLALKRKGNGEEYICEKCKTTYQHSDIHTKS